MEDSGVKKGLPCNRARVCFRKHVLDINLILGWRSCVLGGGGMEILPAEVWLGGSLNIALLTRDEVKEANGLGRGDADLPGHAGSGLMEWCCVSPRQLKLGAIPP